MDFSYFFNTSILQEEKLLSFGFKKEGQSFFLKKNIDDDFYVKVFIAENKIKADVFEISTDEEYVLVNVKNAGGAFVSDIRKSISSLMERVKEECFVTKALTTKFISWIKKEYNVEGEFPWDKSPDFEVFRCPNKKWFALIMNIPLNKLGINSDEKVFVVNLKSDSIPDLVDNKSIFTAWHMNKKYWITVLLTSVTDFKKLTNLTKHSYELVEGHKK